MNILIVDDDGAIVESIKKMVRWNKLGITEVKAAPNAEHAKKLLLEEETDIVISDIEMPGESGLDLLQWYRDRHMSGKFLLLTSHESFQYATEALKLHAEEYLLKPFNVEMVELVLQKMIAQRKAEQEKERQKAYGLWDVRSRQEMSLLFLLRLLSGRILNEKNALHHEMEKMGISLGLDVSYRLVVSRITDIERDIETCGRDLLQFTFENVHSEMLTGNPQNERVIFFEHKDYWIFVAVCDEVPEDDRKETCEELIKKIGNLLNCTMTVCISEPCKLQDFYETFHRNERKLEQNIVSYGKAFLENEFEENADGRKPVLELKQMEEFLNHKDKKEFMDYLKKELNAAARMKMLDGEQMKSIYREVQQAVYAYLASRGILITLVLKDGASMEMSRKAELSVTDMIRWVNYLLGLVFDYEEEVQKSSGIIRKIQMFVQEHYREEIGRNEIGAEFFLVPEYLAKMYKKKTGKSLKDYINEYRLEQARLLLMNTQMKVSDVATEVGFDNFSYFSTLFKKNMGMAPNEYRKQL